MPGVVKLLQDLIRCPSVTPEDAGAQVLLGKVLEKAGFTVHHLPFGEGAERVPNLFARIGAGSPHLCFAGHTDVVPPGPEDQWTFGPFNPEIKDGVIYGRGASDMKGGVAAFAAAAIAYIEKNGAPKGSISFLITGDEEGPAKNGTVKVLEWMKQNGHVPDVALVGEPTNPSALGQEIKIGRRGSLSGRLSVKGKQGHVAYQKLADNPIQRMLALLQALSNHRFDEGNDYFDPTNLEITTVDVGNPATNVIPGEIRAGFNIRFNNNWTKQSLKEKVLDILNSAGVTYCIDFNEGIESFMTEPGAWSDLVRAAVKDVTGKNPALTTTGGTSDARFITHYCPVVECGAINESVHQIDENAKVSDVEKLTKIYERILEKYFV